LKFNKKLPALDRWNTYTVLLNLPTGKVTLADLKSVESVLSKSDIRKLTNLIGYNVDEDTTDWLVDSAISGFLMIISEYANEETVSTTAVETSHILGGKSTEQTFSNFNPTLKSYEPNFEWSKIERVLLPFNKDKCHWILIVLEGKRKIISGTKLLHLI